MTSPAADQPPTTLAPERYLDLLRADATRMAELATPEALGTPVPTCPDWTVTDVLRHTGHVYLHKVANMRTMAAAEFPPPVDPGEDLTGWFLESMETLAAELEERGVDAPSYTWWPDDPTVGFWFRRMAQETAVHRVDVEAALDAVSPIDANLAVDGIDEVLRVFLSDPDLAAPAAEAGIVAVRTGARVWRVAFDEDGVQVRTGPGSADATVTGEPSELYLWLWRRRGGEAVRISGETGAASALREWMRVATQ